MGVFANARWSDRAKQLLLLLGDQVAPFQQEDRIALIQAALDDEKAAVILEKEIR